MVRLYPEIADNEEGWIMNTVIRASIGNILALTLVCGAPVGAAENSPEADDGAMDAEQNGDGETIVSVLQAQGGFEQTLEALDRAGLSETLSGQGPFTVFAPTDAAWQQLEEEQRNHLMSEEGLSDLRDVLSYHVVPDEIRAEDVEQMGSITTIQGQPLEIARDGDQITVNRAAITEPGMEAGNGLVHGIDQVLMPRQ